MQKFFPKEKIGKFHGSEHQVLSYRVDGFCAETNTVYEYHGNEFHGWPPMEYPANKKPTDLNMYGFTYGDLYEKTMSRMKRIKEEGYNVKFVWEHDFVRVESSKMRLEDIVKVL